MNKLITLIFLTLFVSNSYAQKFLSTHTVGEQTKSYSKILVVVKAKDAAYRLETEDNIVKRLKKEDIQAVPSYLRLTNEMLKNKEPDEEELEKLVEQLRENNFDGILVTSLIESKHSVEYNPAQYNTSTVPVRYGRFGRYYGTATVGSYSPATIEEHQKYLLESLLYDLRGSTKENSLHWIGKIKITDPTSFDKASHKYAKSLVKKLAKEAFE